MNDWTFDQECLLANEFDKTSRIPNYKELATLVAPHGPCRDKDGVKVKFENLRACMSLDGHVGMRHGSVLDKVVLMFRLSDPDGFRKYCKKLMKKRLPST